MRPLCVLALMSLAAPARAEPRVVRFTCVIGDGRTRIQPRDREENLDDEVTCRAQVRGLGGRSARDLVAEVSLLPPGSPARVAASDHLGPAGNDRGELRALIPTATWLSAVDWRARPPRLRLALRIYDRPPPGQKRWRLVASSELALGGRRR